MNPTTLPNTQRAKWHHLLAAFFAGAFLANVVPHYIHGVSGDMFPSPFSNPPGKGLSSSTVNVLWALLNLVVGFFLFRHARISKRINLALIIFFIGVVVMSVMLSVSFADKMKM